MIKKGDKVAVEYEGSFDNGEVFDSSRHGEHSHPLVFVVGSGQVIPGFDKAVIGMKQGDKKEVVIHPSDAYGEYDDKLLKDIPREEFQLPGGQEPKEGMVLGANTPDGHFVQFLIVKVDDSMVTLDFNSSMAGKTLHFKIEVVGVNETIKEDSHHH